MRLTDVYVDLMAYVAYFARGAAKNKPPYERVAADIHRLVEDIRGKMNRGEISPEDGDPALFAVVAWVDETIMNSRWEHRGQWQRELLQRKLYNITDAGEKFFERLNAIGPHQTDVREVFYLCLAMGFKGQYCHPGDEILIDQLKTSNLKMLIGSSIGIPPLDRDDLFPEAYPVERGGLTTRKGRGGHFSAFALLCLALPVILFLGLYSVYTFILNNIGSSIFG
jgi:type VI secretion system protein ImpK